MRLLFTLFSILFYNSLIAQCNTFKITSKGDTINCTEASGVKRGKWKIEAPPIRGEKGFIEEGLFVNDKKEGTSTFFFIVNKKAFFNKAFFTSYWRRFYFPFTSFNTTSLCTIDGITF